MKNNKRKTIKSLITLILATVIIGVAFGDFISVGNKANAEMAEQHTASDAGKVNIYDNTKQNNSKDKNATTEKYTGTGYGSNFSANIDNEEKEYKKVGTKEIQQNFENELELSALRKEYDEKKVPPDDAYVYLVQAKQPYFRTYVYVSEEADHLSISEENREKIVANYGYGKEMLTCMDDSYIGTLDNATSPTGYYYFIFLDVDPEIGKEDFSAAKDDIKYLVENMKASDYISIYINTTDCKITDKKQAGDKEEIMKEIDAVEQASSNETIEYTEIYKKMSEDIKNYNQNVTINGNSNKISEPSCMTVPVVIQNLNDDNYENNKVSDDNNENEYFGIDGVPKAFCIDIEKESKEENDSPYQEKEFIFSQDLEDMKDYLENMYIIDLIGDRSYIEGNTDNNFVFYIYDDDNKIKYRFESYEIKPKEADEDKIHPTVSEDSVFLENKGIWLKFSEPVDGADKIEAYKLTNETGIVIEIKEVKSGDRGDTYVLTPSDPDSIEAGEYKLTITCEDITDRSKNKNELQSNNDNGDDYELSLTLESEEAADDSISDSEDESLIKKILEWIKNHKILAIVFVALLVAVMMMVIVCIVHLRRKKTDGKSGNNERTAANRYVVVKETSDGEPIILSIRKEGQIVEEISVNINGSMIVGRADTSDVVIDEQVMSRQHFVIEYDGESFYVQDLETTNGTKLNGILMRHKRRIEKDDCITVGYLDIVVRW